MAEVTDNPEKKGKGYSQPWVVLILIPIAVPIIAGLFSVWGARIGTKKTIDTNGSVINENSAKLKDLNQLIDNLTTKANTLTNQSVPVGTIVASILTREQFAKAAGDPSNFDLRTSKWGFADGGSVDGTDYAARNHEGMID